MMEDENQDNSLRPRPLCVRVKYARIRRMLNMNDIEDGKLFLLHYVPIPILTHYLWTS